jgi:hypothetical protein
LPFSFYLSSALFSLNPRDIFRTIIAGEKDHFEEGKMKFKTMAFITGIALLALGLGYFFFGAFIVGRWGVEATASVLLLARRIGCLYLGLALVFFLARKAPTSPARTALSAGAVVITLLLAGTGVCALALGHAGNGILISAAIELLLGFGFIWVLLAEKKTPG